MSVNDLQELLPCKRQDFTQHRRSGYLIKEISMPSNTEAWRNLLLTGAGDPSEPHLSLVRSYARSTRGRQTLLSLVCRRHEHMHDMELLHVVLAQHRSVASKAIDTIADAASQRGVSGPEAISDSSSPPAWSRAWPKMAIDACEPYWEASRA